MVKNSTMSALDENKALVRRHLEEAVNLERPQLGKAILAEDFISRHPLVEPGRAGYAAGLGLLRAGFPDLNVEVLDVVAENDRVVVRYIERGTHTGDFMDLPPTGRSYEKQGFALYRVADGRLAECWLQEDDLGFQQQLFS
jgi:predicted ester cyclase